jgi:PLP dependent protein
LNITGNLIKINKAVPGYVRVIAVSKMQPVSALMEAYHAGQRVFGENKVQELVFKHAQLPSDIEWHFIGHLQTNKVRYLAPFISLIHSIDSLNLLKEVNKEAIKNNRIIDCLLQFHIAAEETKFGLSTKEAVTILDSKDYQTMNNVRITGVMGMSSFSDDKALVRSEFKSLYDCFLTLKGGYFKKNDAFNVVSMGMSGDYQIAIEEGSTMIRIGTSIFGERKY